jgi:hypothetical protein
MAKETLSDAFAKRRAQDVKKEETVTVITAEQKELFKKRFGNKMAEFETIANGRQLIFIKVDDSLAVLRPPTAEDLGDYLMAIAENGMAKAASMIVEKLWLDGDIELINDEDKWCAVFIKMNAMLEGKKAEFFRN